MNRKPITSLLALVVGLQSAVAEPPPTLRPGLVTQYYSLGDTFLPDFQTLAPYTSCFHQTICFAQTDGPFGCGGRIDSVGAVFTGTINILETTLYRFCIDSDDGSALYVDDLLVVANDGWHVPTRREGVIPLAAGPHVVRVEYFEAGGGAGLCTYVQRADLPGCGNPIPISMWAPLGVQGDYYELDTTSCVFPNFAARTPYHREIRDHLNRPCGARPDGLCLGSGRRFWFGATFDGFLIAPESGTYTLWLDSNDGSRLFINGARAIDNDGCHPCSDPPRSAPVNLIEGSNPIRVEWFQGPDECSLVLEIEGPNLPRQVVPASMFAHEVHDCDEDGVPDEEQATEILDLGDLLIRGDGHGSESPGAGIDQCNGHWVPAGTHNPGGCDCPPGFHPTDGQDGRALIPSVDGVFLPRGVEPLTISTASHQFVFSPTTGCYFDAIRGSVFAAVPPPEPPIVPIVLCDRPGSSRSGIGMHTNAGVTFDLNQIRSSNRGRTIRAFSAIAGTNASAWRRDQTSLLTYFEMWVIVDGQLRYRRLFGDPLEERRGFDPIFVEISPDDRYLTLAATDAGLVWWDHAAWADAHLILNTEFDRNGDGILDACQCLGDLDADNDVDLQDLTYSLANFGTSDGAGPEDGDLDADGDVDLQDLAFLLSQFGLVCV